MQTFNLINAQDRVKKSRATINANFEAVASNFSGIAFPTVNLYVGMKCYRTDLNQTFTLNNVELQTWVDDSDIADKAITTEKLADQSVTKEKISHGAVTTEKIGNSAVTVDKIASRSITQDKIAIGILTAHNVGAYTQNEVYNKGELFNRTESDNRYYQKAQTYSKAETYNRGEVDNKVNTCVSKSGDTMTGPLNFANNVGTCLRGTMADNDVWRIYAGDAGSNVGYLALDTCDDGAEEICVRQFTGKFQNQVRVAQLLKQDGATTFPVSVTAPAFYSNDWFRARGNSGFYFQDHGGGWNMTDSDWIRTFGGKNLYCDKIIKAGQELQIENNGSLRFVTHNGGWYMQDNDWVRSIANKNIYTAGKMKADGGFEGKASSAGRADSAAVSDKTVRVENGYKNMRFNWKGQGGQPTWLWGGNGDGENMYIYNPSNFTVSRANTAGRADSAATADNANNLQNWSLQRILDEIKQRSPQIAILTGEIAHGGTIPLPNGYKESQCKWIVSMANDNPNNTSWDIEEGGMNLHYKFICTTDGRKVNCQTRLGHQYGAYWVSSIASYIIIGVK